MKIEKSSTKIEKLQHAVSERIFFLFLSLS